MLISFSTAKDVLDFLLEYYVTRKEFETWDCTKFIIDCDKLAIEVNTTFYDFGVEHTMRFGDSDINSNSFLYLIQTNDTNNKIKHNYLAQALVYHNKQERFYLKPLLEEIIKKYKNFSFDIKLRYPKGLKGIFDKNNEYDSFNINFFSNNLNSHGIIFSYSESKKETSTNPPVLWTSFCYNLYLDYINNKINSTKSL